MSTLYSKHEGYWYNIQMFIDLKDRHKQLFTDTRSLGLMAFAVIALLVTWSGIKSIQTNYELQKQISQLTQENNVRKLENTNLELRNEYYKTDQFLELAARRQFGRAAPGETVLNVPKSVALTNSSDLPKDDEKIDSSDPTKPKYQQNLEAWFNFFLHQKD